jgi:predicted SAM-dependent methyltransferase
MVIIIVEHTLNHLYINSTLIFFLKQCLKFGGSGKLKNRIKNKTELPQEKEAAPFQK